MIRGVGPYSTLITPRAGSLFHAEFQEERPPGRERRADGSADLNTTFLLPWHRRQAAGPQPTADLRLTQIKVLEPQRSYSAGQIARRVTA